MDIISSGATAAARALEEARSRSLTMLPSRRRPFSALALLLQFLLFFTAMATVPAAGDHFAITEHACFCDQASLQTCECLCVGGGDTTTCYLLGRSNSNIGRRNNSGFRPRRPFGSKDPPTRWGVVPRGGASVHEKSFAEQQSQESQVAENSSPQQQQQVVIPPSSLPLIDTKSVCLALRLTCETNRRLQRGTSGFGAYPPLRDSATGVESSGSAAFQPHPSQQLQHPQQQQHEQQTIPPAIRSLSREELLEERWKEETTVFHFTKPWEGPATGTDRNATATDGLTSDDDGDGAATQSGTSPITTKPRMGILRWGPDLQSYLSALLSAIGLDSQHVPEKHLSPMEDEVQLILALTLLYLDHSTSFDTPPLHVDPNTGRPWFPPCPYLVPRSVHRTVLTAFVLAVKCVRGYVDHVTDHSTVLSEAANSMLGEDRAISEEELAQMESWMLHALDGGNGGAEMHQQHRQISQEEIAAFLRRWGATFYPSRLAAHDRARTKQLESFWRHRESSFFGSGHGEQHGHGNAHWHSDDPLQYASHDGQWQHPEQQHFYHNDAQPQRHYDEGMGSEAF